MTCDIACFKGLRVDSTNRGLKLLPETKIRYQVDETTVGSFTPFGSICHLRGFGRSSQQRFDVSTSSTGCVLLRPAIHGRRRSLPAAETDRVHVRRLILFAEPSSSLASCRTRSCALVTQRRKWISENSAAVA